MGGGGGEACRGRWLRVQGRVGECNSVVDINRTIHNDNPNQVYFSGVCGGEMGARQGEEQ